MKDSSFLPKIQQEASHFLEGNQQGIISVKKTHAEDFLNHVYNGHETQNSITAKRKSNKTAWNILLKKHGLRSNLLNIAPCFK